MATYKQIQEFVKDNYGYTAKTCWIAHMKEVSGLQPRMSPRRHSPHKRVHPCPEAKKQDICEAFRHFGMI